MIRRAIIAAVVLIVLVCFGILAWRFAKGGFGQKPAPPVEVYEEEEIPVVDDTTPMAQQILAQNAQTRILAAAGDNSAWIENGRATVLGANAFGQCDTKSWPKVDMVRLGEQHAVGLAQDGSLVFSGSNDRRQCELNAQGQPVRSIEAGPYASYAVLMNGTVRVSGDSPATPTELRGERNVLAVSAGVNHLVLLRADGTLKAYGRNEYGECDVGDWQNIVMVDCGFDFTVALDAEGGVHVAGNTDKINVADAEGIRTLAAGVNNCYLVDAEGGVTAVGYNGGKQLDAAAWQNAVAIAGGYMHVIGIDGEGHILVAGNNESGQLGD